MVRRIIAVIVGYAVWTAIWVGGGFALFAEAGKQMQAGTPLTDLGTLAALLGVSILCSLAAGATVGAIVRAKCAGTALILGVLLLLTGIGVQAGAWKLMPLWYHLSFLAFLIPATLLGARLIPRKA